MLAPDANRGVFVYSVTETPPDWHRGLIHGQVRRCVFRFRNFAQRF